jgi:hypothetical protein
MAEFMVECYVSREDGDRVTRVAESARRAVEELNRKGIPVRYLRSIFVPEEETCFFLYEASSADVVREAARRSSLPFEHVVQVAAQARGAETQ